MWNFEINNNGNTSEDIKKRFVDVVEACHKMENALSGLSEVVNGRNYQTILDGQNIREQDVEVLRGMIISIRQIRDMSIGGAAKAIKHREKL